MCALEDFCWWFVFFAFAFLHGTHSMAERRGGGTRVVEEPPFGRSLAYVSSVSIGVVREVS